MTIWAGKKVMLAVLFTKYKKTVFLCLASILLFLSINQVLFQALQKNNTHNVIKSVQSLLKNDTSIHNTTYIARTIRQLENIGYFKCSVLSVKKPYKKDFLNLKYDKKCNTSILWLDGVKTKVPLTAINGAEWELEFVTINSIEFSISLWLSRLGISILILMGFFFHVLKLEKDSHIHQKNLEKEVIKTKALEAIANSTSMIAHDIRRPFNNLKTFLDLLPNRLGDFNFVESTSKSIIESAQSVRNMLDEMMEYSKKKELVKESIEIETFLKSVITDLFFSEQNSPLSFKFTYPNDHFIELDPQKMKRVFQNILSNAYEAMNKNGLIWINISKKEKFTIISIGNNGPSIPTEQLSQLFEPFKTFGKKKGTGLGLAISKQLVEAHDGELSVENTHEGPEFKITLPHDGTQKKAEQIEKSFMVSDLFEKTSAPPQEAKETTKEPVSSLAHLEKVKNILILQEDNPETGTLLKGLLPQATSTLCGSEDEAVDLCLEQLYQMVLVNLSDLEEPALNKMVTQLKNYLPDATYMIVSDDINQTSDDPKLTWIKSPLTKEILEQALTKLKG